MTFLGIAWFVVNVVIACYCGLHPDKFKSD